MTGSGSSAPARSPMGAGALLDTAFRLYFRGLRQFFPAAVTAFAPATLVNLIYSARPPRPEPGWLTWPLYGAGAMLTCAATSWIASERYLGRRVSAVHGLQLAVRRLPTLILFSLAAALVTILGTALFVLPGILVLGALSIGIPLIMLERESSLRVVVVRSLGMTRDRRVALAGYLGMGIGIALIVVLGAAITATFAATLAGIDPINGGGRPAAVVETLLMDLLVQAAVPFTACLLTVLYYDLRVRREAVDLEASVGGQDDATN
ncbi:MAG: hypothetical protein ABJD11_02730 [Gemmatimonadota bacterium]